MKISPRWSIVNRNTGNVRRNTATRDAARNAKRNNERIYDRQNSVFVR